MGQARLRRVARRAVDRATSPIHTLVDRRSERRTSAQWSAAGGVRGVAPFSAEQVLASFAHEVEIEGRRYAYVLYPGSGDALAVHFSAFWGEWGDRREHRAQFAGHFHRLRMFWPLTDYSFLFLCDTFGADANGTYYKGEAMDFFVERAMDASLDDLHRELDVGPDRTVTLGSSMGATAALRFALRRGYAGAIGVCPHIDLDLSAIHQGRQRHVAAVVGRDDVTAPELFDVTREIRRLADAVECRPRIVLQSMQDDAGVHEEQVLPFVEQWRARGGEVTLDERPVGGHTSEYATADWFEAQLRWCLGD